MKVLFSAPNAIDLDRTVVFVNDSALQLIFQLQCRFCLSSMVVTQVQVN